MRRSRSRTDRLLSSLPLASGLPTTMSLTTGQRNDLFNWIKDCGLDLEKGWDLKIGTQDACIMHMPSQSIFTIRDRRLLPISADEDCHRDANYFRWTYEYQSRVGASSSSRRSSLYDSGSRWWHPANWNDIKGGVADWAKEIKREYVDPDLWADLKQMREFFGDSRYAFLGNNPFTDAELLAIGANVREAKESIREESFQEKCPLSSEQLSTVDAKLDEILEASHRIGRKDWLLLSIGTLSTLFLSGIISPEAVTHILMMCLHGLGHLFGIGDPPIEGPHSS